MTNQYRVVAKVYKPWFRKVRLRYHVVESFKYWDDPSYGHGGGNWRDGERSVAAFDSKRSAAMMAYDLNYNK